MKETVKQEGKTGKGDWGGRKKRIRGFSRRRVEWLGGRIIELPLIPSSPLSWVKRGKKLTEKEARVRPRVFSLLIEKDQKEKNEKDRLWKEEG